MIKWLENVGIRDLTYAKEKRFILIAGPCVIEDPDQTESIAKAILSVIEPLGIPFVFKASYDKANRTSIKGYRGVGMETGLAVLHHIRETYKIPVLSDVHSVEEIQSAKKVLDFIQIPAFLSRQTDLIVEAAKTNKVINVKKGPFLSPYDMGHVIEKIRSTGNNKFLITERGTTFGYNSLVNDFTGIPVMSNYAPVLFDATHSVQSPGGQNGRSGGNRPFIPTLARAAIAAGAVGLYLEVHPDPERSLSDSAVVFPLSRLKLLLKECLEIYELVSRFPKWEREI
ncbi:MAG: 2-dehydro-3-deoxyphosphooctonate aldolase [bacterium]|nr:MAG: 2-dehydro-3-deoxyphosphooctonate aldolase [bacterium]